MYPNVDSPNPSSVKLRLSDDNWTANRTVSRYVLRTWIVSRTTNQTSNRTMADRYSIKDLMERYSRNSRDTIYRWCQQAQIQLSQDERGLSYATLEQVNLLDQVAEHVNDGRALKHFIPASSITVESPSDKTSDTLSDSSSDSDLDVRSKSDNVSDAEMLWQLVGAIASNLQVRSPLQAYRDLEEARQQQWKLSTAQVRQLIGVRPHGAELRRGSWIFRRDGKIGAQSAWRVHKICENNGDEDE